jgi:hypothetical protein
VFCVMRQGCGGVLLSRDEGVCVTCKDMRYTVLNVQVVGGCGTVREFLTCTGCVRRVEEVLVCVCVYDVPPERHKVYRICR